MRWSGLDAIDDVGTKVACTWAMITSTTQVPRGDVPVGEARGPARAERGTDFREEVARGRERERSTAERSRGSEAGRSPASERDREVSRERETDAVEDQAPSEEVTADAAGAEARDRTPATGTSSDTPEDAASPATSAHPRGDGAKEAIATRPTPKTAAELVLPGMLPTSSASPIELLDLARGVPPQGPALLEGKSSVPSTAVATPTVNPHVAKPAGAGPSAVLAANPAAAGDATAAEAVDLPHGVRTESAVTDNGSNALAIASRGSASIANVAPTAPLEALVPPRLAPAQIPQFLETLQVRVDGAAGNAFVELEPVELGRLTVELTLQPEGGVRADVRAERPDGYAALEARLPEMRAALIGRGFASADVQISFGLAQRDPRRDSGSADPRRSQRDTARNLDTERVLALAPSRSGSIDLWA